MRRAKKRERPILHFLLRNGAAGLLAAMLTLLLLTVGICAKLLPAGMRQDTASANDTASEDDSDPSVQNGKKAAEADDSYKYDLDKTTGSGMLLPEYRVFEETPILRFRISDLSPQVETGMDYVDVWYSPYDDSRYIFLPATADRSSLTVTYSVSGGEKISLDDTELVSGQKTDLFGKADEFDLYVGNVSYGKVHVMQSELNVVYLATKTGGMSNLNSSILNAETAEALMLYPDGSVTYQGHIDKISGRGNSSWDYAKDYKGGKKPYNIKLPQKAGLYGMGKAKKWALISNFTDQSMLRNTVAVEMGRSAGMEYNLNSVYVDLYADGDYRGTYQIYEKPQVQKNRVSITDLEEATEAVNPKALDTYPMSGTQEYVGGSYKYRNIPNNPADITGGYLLEFQMYGRYKNKTDCGFVTSRGQAIEIRSPEYTTKKQTEYIRQFVQDLEDAIYGDKGYNAKGKHYSEYVDVDSFIKAYILQESTQNPDAWGSFFLWKDSDSAGDGKLHFSPAWDFDMAFYNFARAVDASSPQSPNGVVKYYASNVDQIYIGNYPIEGYLKQDNYYAIGYSWYNMLYHTDESFLRRVSQLYFECFDDCITQLTDRSQEGGSLIEQYRDSLYASAQMNMMRFHMYGAAPYKAFGPYNGETYEDIVEFLRHRLEQRQQFLRKEWLGTLKDALQNNLDAELDKMDLARYDTEERLKLDEILSDGRSAIDAAKASEDANAAYADTRKKIAAIPKREISGDFNDSLDVDVRDAEMLLEYYAKSLANQADEITATQRRNGDVDKNGKLDAVDALHILRHYTSALSGNNSYSLPVVNRQPEAEE